MPTPTPAPVHRPRASSRAVAALLSGVLLLAACGGGSEAGDGRSGWDMRDSERTEVGQGGSDPDVPDGDGEGTTDDPGSTSSGSSGTSGADLAALTEWAAETPNVVVPEPGDVAFDVEFSGDTAVVSHSAVVEASDDHRYVLDARSPGAGELRPGSVLLIPGVALRRVTSVDEAGGRLTVETEFAALTDAIENGDIAWDVDLPVGSPFQTDPDTTPLDVPVASPIPDTGADTLVAEGAGVILPDGTHQQVSWNLTQNDELPLRWQYQDGYNTYLFALGVGANDLTVRVQVTRDLGGRTALAYTATGTVRPPRSAGSIRIRDGQLDQASIDQMGLSGTVELEIAAAGAGKAPVDFELPGLWFKYIIPVGPIPLTLGMNARVIGDVEVPAEASAQASARFSFGGDMGFAFEGGSVDAKVTMPDLGAVPQPADSAAMIGNYVNAEFGLAFPHMSISLFDQGVVPRVYPGMIIGTRLQWGPVCKTAYTNLVVQGAYDFKILGVNLMEGKPTDLIQPHRIDAQGDSCE